MEWLGWLATALSIIGIFLNAKKIIWCWPVWLISNVAWISYFILKWDPPSLIMWFVFACFNIYGWLQWRKDRKPKFSSGKYNYRNRE